jgi:hypothetical protein
MQIVTSQATGTAAPSPTIVRIAECTWRRGADVLSALAPHWRANLGPADQVFKAYGSFELMPFSQDPATGRRFELIRCAPGYADVTDAFHDTVEESMVLEGSSVLSGEGPMRTGTYFWRPPGFIHGCTTEIGFLALVSCEGVNPQEGSGPVTRHVRPTEQAGINALQDNAELAGGPRGRVCMLDTTFQPWVPMAQEPRALESLAGFDPATTEVKVLSWNPATGGMSALVRLGQGAAAEHRGHETLVLEGALEVAGLGGMSTYDYLRGHAVITAGEQGASLFVKADGAARPAR